MAPIPGERSDGLMSALFQDASGMQREPAAGGDERSRVRAAMAGDVAAFEALYRHYAARIHALCLRMTGNRAAAEDCVQETFVQAWQKLADFEERSAFGTWLHAIAVNRVLGWQRAESRRPSGHLAAVDADRPDPWGADPRTPDVGLDLDLERAIATLPDGARNVLLLHTVGGFSHEETAELLGIAVGTSKAQLHRARRLLEARLG
jgi:RNA polymerase sigma-70 factor (ECF subfamily)